MKYLPFVIAVIGYVSCNNPQLPANTPIPKGKQWIIPLENNLDTVKIYLPDRLDTLFSWTQYSDCGDGCAHVDYRVQPRLLPIFKESGFLYDPLEDSVEQFTIKHTKLNYELKMTDSTLIQYLTAKLKDDAWKYPSDKYIIDTLLRIQGRPCPVIAFVTYDSTKKHRTQYLNGFIPLPNNTLEIYFEHRKSYPDTAAAHFIQEAFDALKTLRVGTGN